MMENMFDGCIPALIVFGVIILIIGIIIGSII